LPILQDPDCTNQIRRKLLLLAAFLYIEQKERLELFRSKPKSQRKKKIMKIPNVASVNFLSITGPKNIYMQQLVNFCPSAKSLHFSLFTVQYFTCLEKYIQKYEQFRQLYLLR
jgi:hypothetical protein